MITITQFTLPQLKAAHLILSKAPKAPAAAPAPAEAEPEQPPASMDAAGESGAAAPDAEAMAQAKAQAEGKPQADAAPEGPSAEVIAELVEKVPVAEAKVPYLLGAMKVAGNRIQKVRQVRVVQVEGAPAGAVKHEEAAYILDMLPEAANRGGNSPRGGGRDGDRRGGKGGPKGRGNERGKPGDKRGGPGGRGPGAGGDRPQAGRGPGRPGGTPNSRG